MSRVNHLLNTALAVGLSLAAIASATAAASPEIAPRASGPAPASRQASPPATTQSASCGDAVISAPAAPATVSAAWTSFGRVLVVGSGPYAGCSLYLLTSDQLHALTGAPFACSDNPNVKNKPCDTVLWPALLTNGAPIAGPGVNPRLLGTVTRTDLGLSGVSSAQQVTYAGHPLYRFFRDQAPGDIQGANLNDPVSRPAGIWYLLNPRGGSPAPGRARLELETAPIDGTGPDETVLAARLNNDYSQFPNASFPVYALRRGDEGRWQFGSHDRDRDSACYGQCAVFWPPVLTSGWPELGPGVDQRAVGISVRHDGTEQLTYHGRPLYLFNGDAYLGTATSPVGTQGIYGAGAVTPSGVFNTIPPLH